ncbi:MAG: hypothetical protein KHZ24_11410 [Coriobacteriia bacterium]|nr:hypothetical protein [Coriobacteriia bacterium]
MKRARQASAGRPAIPPRRHRATAVGALAACALASTLCLSAAIADEAEQAALAIQQASSPVTDAVPSEIQQRVEDSAAAYNDAVAAREDVERRVADNEARIAELEAALPELRDKAAAAISASYKYQLNGGGLLELVLYSDTFETFISTLTYLNAVQDSHAEQINELLAVQAELDTTRSELDAALQQASEAEQAAADALAEAQAAREEAIRQAQEAARRAAEEEAARQAAAAAAAAQQQAVQDAGTGGSTEAGGAEEPADSGEQVVTPEEAPVETPEDAGDVPSDEGSSDDGSEGSVDWGSADKSAFVAQWADRIDAYLSWSPMAGQGATFAAAAWDYGIDPRWSPAIAYVESSLGTYCFLPHNAWGWGSSSWGSWEEAIYAHVAGLARGYGPTFDYDDALSYCPPTADEWYSSVLGQMSAI